MKTTICIICILLGPVFSANINPESAIGSRAFSLGQSTTVSYSDILNSINNPASLYYSKNFNTSFFYSEPITDTQNYGLGFTIPTKNYGTFGFRYFNFSVNNIENRNSINEEIVLFSFLQNEYVISYGYQFYDQLVFGFNAKWLNESLSGLSTTAFPVDHMGIDLSFSLFPNLTGEILKNIGLGIVFKNLIQSNDSGYLPKRIMMLVENGYKISNHSIFIVMNYGLGETDFKKNETQFNIGLEYGYDFMFLRIGYSDDLIALGTGIHYKYFALNYGYGIPKSSSINNNPIHNFSLNFEL